MTIRCVSTNQTWFFRLGGGGDQASVLRNGCLCCFGLLLASSLSAAPTLLITNLPAYGSSQPLAGLVAGVDPAQYEVAVCVNVPGYGWVNKPTCANLFTAIQSDGSWTTDITTGGSDSLATRIAAFLLPSNAPLTCVQGQPFLTNVYAQSVASAIVTRPYPGPRWLSFSGYDWWVKTGTGKVGPGPNYFSGSTNNVFLDSSGNLHLKITYQSNQWACAEIVSARSFGYGSYRFQLLTDVNALDANVVLGLFTWSDDPAFAHREIDVECSRWSNPSDLRNSQFVVQPFNLAGHLVRYTVPAQLTNSTQSFIWESNSVFFQSQRGNFSPSPAASNLISSWTYTQAPPQVGDENVHLNLWLNGGNPPTNGQEVEVIIKSFQFVPPGIGSPSKLIRPRQTSHGAAFDLLTEPDRRYAIQNGQDLVNWQEQLLLLATNLSAPVQVPDPPPEPSFFRAVTLP